MQEKHIQNALMRGLHAALMTLTIGGFTTAANAQQASAPPPQNLPRILVLATGGTIASTSDPRSAIGYNAGGITGDQLLASVPGLDKIASIKAEQISNVGSQDMNGKIWYQLAIRIKQAIDRNEVDGIVITHGTDTMEETGFFLDHVLSTSKPVVLVGSMRPGGSTSADGPMNLYEAAEVAASPQSVNRGVLMVMNDTINSPRWATKTNTTSVQTFQNPNAGPLGYVDAASIRYLSPAPTSHRKALELPSGGLPPAWTSCTRTRIWTRRRFKTLFNTTRRALSSQVSAMETRRRPHWTRWKQQLAKASSWSVPRV
ncbi:L-asparaginase [Burkholderia pseudomallei]|nr:L-asparaginase [Burkholderia pseudomallei]